jgi:tyrosine-protein phosphatase YwqE
MFNIFRKKNTPVYQAGSLPVTTDIHSHILPGIDDGAPDITTSVILIKGLYALGIRKTIATPHIIGDLYRNTPETINAALEKTRKACLDAGINMEIEAAAEYMLDDHFMELIRQKKPLLPLHKKLLLTEIPYSMPPRNLEEMAFTIITEGYQPVLAHPERYNYFHQDFKEYYHLQELGFHLQVNFLSLTGYYGKNVSRAAKYILDNHLAKLVATDLHHQRHLEALQAGGNQAVINKYCAGRNYNELDGF